MCVCVSIVNKKKRVFLPEISTKLFDFSFPHNPETRKMVAPQKPRHQQINLFYLSPTSLFLLMIIQQQETVFIFIQL